MMSRDPNLPRSLRIITLRSRTHSSGFGSQRADFWMYEQSCPNCGKRLDAHDFDVYNICKALYLGLDVNTSECQESKDNSSTNCLNCGSETTFIFSDGSCAFCHAAFMRGIENTPSISVMSQGSVK